MTIWWFVVNWTEVLAFSSLPVVFQSMTPPSASTSMRPEIPGRCSTFASIATGLPHVSISFSTIGSPLTNMRSTGSGPSDFRPVFSSSSFRACSASPRRCSGDCGVRILGPFGAYWNHHFRSHPYGVRSSKVSICVGEMFIRRS